MKALDRGLEDSVVIQRVPLSFPRL
jgi:hypothetical protein